jgi:diadenylate cyclase
VELREDDSLRATLAAVAPGTELRDGLERILRGRTGALIVLGSDRTVESLATGGFPLDVEFSATRLRELAKMDGAIVCDREASRILRAATQLVPDPTIETSESGTRHRTAERVAKQTGYPVISVSQSMRIVALYVDGRRHVLEDSSAILSRANQALQTLERYKNRLDEVTGTLSALELTGGLGNDRELVIRDYLPLSRVTLTVDEAMAALEELTSTELLDLSAGAKAVGFAVGGDALDSAVSPCGYRLLTKVPRLPGAIVDRLVDHFGSLQKLLAANLEELMDVEGVGEGRARAVREGLSRLAESSILERYV